MVQGVTSLHMDLHLNPVARDALHTNLHAAMAQLCGMRRDPTRGPLEPQPLVHRLNNCLPIPLQFPTNVPQCAGEFLAALVGELALAAGFLVEHREVGVCQACGGQYDQVAPL